MNSLTPKKDYYAPMHTAEHILNRVMVTGYNCGRSKNTHIEKNKSKCDYPLPSAPEQREIDEIEARVNAVIKQNLAVTARELPLNEVSAIADISKLPPSAGDKIKVVFVGDFDACPCIGAHVGNTSEIPPFKITTWTYENGVLRLRYKLIEE